jgi:cytochrome c551/c552
MKGSLLVAAALAASSTPALAIDFAQAQPALAKNGCQSCHGLADQVNGPSFRDIASRYLNKPDERSYLADKIRKGSSNTWGAAAMPPSGQIDDLDLKTIVEWIASGAPGPAAPQ